MPTTSSKRCAYDLIAPAGSSRKMRSTRNSGTNIVIITISSSSPRASWRIQSSNESRMIARIVTPAAESARRTPKNFSFGLMRFTITSDCGSKPSIIALAQFNEHAVSRGGMQERDATSMRARHRILVDETETLLLEVREMRVDVVDAETDVMNPFAAFLDELRDRRVGAGWLEQFEIRIADTQKRGLHALRLDDFDVIDGETEGFVDLCGFDRTNRDADVIEHRLSAFCFLFSAFSHTPVTSAPQMC